MQSLVEKYQPRKIADFVGIAEAKVVMSTVAAQPYSSVWLLVGGAGLGKTTIAQSLFEAISGMEFGKAAQLGVVQHIPARMCDLETVARVTDACYTAPMWGRFNLVLGDEIDQATKAAQVAWLSTLDSTRMPQDTVFVFTSNNIEKLEERFVSRCKVLTFDKPTAAELAEFLMDVWSRETDAPIPDLTAVIEAAKGSVRTALNGLEVKLLVAKSASANKTATGPAASVGESSDSGWMAKAAAAMAKPVAPPAATVKPQIHLAKDVDGKYKRFEAGASCPCEKCRKAAGVAA